MDQWLELSSHSEKVAGSAPGLSVWSLHVLQIWVFSWHLAGLAFSFSFWASVISFSNCCANLSYWFAEFILQFELS